MIKSLALCAVKAAIIVLFWTSASQAQVGTTFTYQGYLENSSEPANGSFNMTFSLFPQASGGNHIGNTINVPGVAVTDGAFSVQLDFGSAAFTGAPRWLEIQVDGNILSPRQPITPAPYAIHAANAPPSTWQVNGAHVYYNTGNVGIGTTAPNYSLEIRRTDPGIALLNEAETVTGLVMADSQAFLSENASVLFDAGNPSLRFVLNSSEKMRITPNGVGFGTTSPAADLHVRGIGPLGRLLVTPGAADSSAELMLTENTSASLGAIVRYDGASNQLQMLGQNSGDVGPHLVIGRENGRVGIGAPTPANLLEVQGVGTEAGGVAGFNEVVAKFLRPSGGHSAVAVDAAADQDAILYFAENGSAQWSIRTDHDACCTFPQLNVRYQGGGRNDTALRFVSGGSSGEVSIVPGADNNVNLGSQIGGSWKSISTYALQNLSDARKKLDIHDLDYGLAELEQLRPVRFRWSERPQDGEVLGVIAQEVQPVLPEVVHSEPGDPQQILAVDYLGLIPVLIRGVQQQQELIASLDRRNRELESRLAEVEALLDRSAPAAVR